VVESAVPPGPCSLVGNCDVLLCKGGCFDGNVRHCCIGFTCSIVNDCQGADGLHGLADGIAAIIAQCTGSKKHS
jgi:hypothetical protein